MELNDQAIVTLTATGAKHLNDFYGYYAKNTLLWAGKRTLRKGMTLNHPYGIYWESLPGIIKRVKRLYLQI